MVVSEAMADIEAREQALEQSRALMQDSSSRTIQNPSSMSSCRRAACFGGSALAFLVLAGVVVLLSLEGRRSAAQPPPLRSTQVVDQEGFQWVELGRDTACQAEADSSNSAVEKGVAIGSMADCIALGQSSAATAVQFKPGNCSVWAQRIARVDEAKGAQCVVLVPRGEFLPAQDACGNASSSEAGDAAEEAQQAAPAKVLRNVTRALCKRLCLANFGKTCAGVSWAPAEGGNGTATCGMWQSPPQIKGPTNFSCYSFHLSEVNMTVPLMDDDDCSTPLCRVQSWDGWATVFPWMVTSTSTTTTTTTVTATSTTTTTTTTTTTRTTTTSLTSTTTSTTTTTNCQTVQPEDPCYGAVLQAMREMRDDAGKYEGLSPWSSFEEVQAHLHKAGRAECSLPCDCHTAVVGEHCYGSVMWAMNVGVFQHPEWYGGLTKDSSFQDFQMHLHVDTSSDGNCSVPCKAPFSGSPSLFCFAIVRPDGYEPKVMKAQLGLGAGIFGCDGFAILSSASFVIGQGPGRLGEVRTVPFDPAPVGVSKDGTAANTELFMTAWAKIRDATNALQYDWTLKVDPDAVVLHDRLRQHLAAQTGQNVYVRNCNKVPESPNFPMMFGSLEVFSKSAMEAYFNGGDKKCADELPWQSWGEDLFMGKCLDHLGVSVADDFSIISDEVCLGVDCSDGAAGAFHPFKDADSWVNCWNQATQGAPPAVPVPDA